VDRSGAGACRSQDDPLNGWRPLSQKSLHRAAEDKKRREIVTHYMGKGIFDPHLIGVTAGAGVTRAHLRNELVNDREWSKSWIYNEVLRPSHVDEILVGVQTITPCRESYICMDRAAGDPPFRVRESDLLQLILSGCPPRSTARLFRPAEPAIRPAPSVPVSGRY
jgi:hypothetical protein